MSDHQAQIGYAPTLTTQLLRGCRMCRAPHPRAMRLPPDDLTICPRCGTPSAPPGHPVVMDATMGGIAGALIAVGNFFHRMHERLSK